ncbi:MAG TPA: hypothetical protein VHF23_05925 [Gaiellaceae bacterium]|nr:hypothetical protein [Gaiellaceae bacterium]
MAIASERIGKNEALFREVNERILGASAGFYVSETDEGIDFVCECSDPACYAPVPLRVRDYETVRSQATHFLVAPGHLWHPDTERRVAGNERYWVVEKASAAARVAAVEDPPT